MDLFASPIKTARVRKGTYAHGYRNGIINIDGEKYEGYTMREAIALYRKQFPFYKD